MSPTLINWKPGLILLAVILMAPTAVGQPTVFLHLESDSLHLDTAATKGNFTALALDAFDGVSPASSSFSLQGNMRMEVDHADPVVKAQATTVNPEATTQIEGDAFNLVSGTNNRAGHSLTIIAEPGTARAMVDSKCGEIHHSPRDTVIPQRFVNAEREPPSAGTSNALYWRDCGFQSTLRIEGDFLFSLWEWDIQAITEQGESRLYQSGYSPSEHAPGLYPDVAQANQLWFFVQDGTLSMPLTEKAELYLGPTDINASSATLLGASGHFWQDGVPTRITPSQVDLEGDLELEVTRTGPLLRTHVEGDIERIEANGRSLEFTPAPGSPDKSFGWVPLVAVGFLVIVAAGGFGAYAHPINQGRRTARPKRKPRSYKWTQYKIDGYIGKASICQMREEHKGEVRYLTKALHLGPANPWGWMQRGVANRKLGEYEKALSDHRESHMWMEGIRDHHGEPIENAVQAARAASLAGDRDTAFWWLEQAVSQDPEVAKSMDGEPDFAKIRDDSRYHGVKTMAYDKEVFGDNAS